MSQPLTDEEPAEAIAVQDGQIAEVGSGNEGTSSVGPETESTDLEGRTVLPGFIAAHAHMSVIGQYELEVDLTDADSPEACLDCLKTLRDGRTGTDRQWILGFGYDESTWSGESLARVQLDEVSDERTVDTTVCD